MSESTPKLAAPGAGLPAMELMIARFGFRVLRAVRKRAAWTRLFADEKESMLRLVSGMDEALAGKQILIARLRGLEDSSRFWSVWMVLDHLNIVNGGITEAITSMTNGVVPSAPARTADVKPRPEAGKTTLEEFRSCCDQLEQTVAGIPDLKKSVRYNHPWFGPLDAEGWHAMAAFHMQLHRKQIEAIQHGLSSALPADVTA